MFGGLFAALLPLVVGGLAIIGTLGMLRVITLFADVSIFSLDLTTAMGLALAIDYTLLLISRYREEYAEVGDRDIALRRAVATAGRTILFSACTVFLAVSALAVFPMYFLRSMAYAGCGVVALAGLYAVVVAPAVIKLLGDRIESLNIRALFKRTSRTRMCDTVRCTGSPHLSCATPCHVRWRWWRCCFCSGRRSRAPVSVCRTIGFSRRPRSPGRSATSSAVNFPPTRRWPPRS